MPIATRPAVPGARRSIDSIVLSAALAISAAVFAPRTAAQQRFEETVVVTATAKPCRLGNVGRSIATIEREQIEQLPVRSVAELLRYLAGIEVKTRAEGGVQSDFSVRGASFGQTLVLVDGVRLNDSQTGHHNADLPVPLQDIERIEVLRGPGSSLHGADAFGGTIQIITRRTRPPWSAELSSGSFGFVAGAATGRKTWGERAVGLTIAGKRSDGFTDDRDYRVLEGRGEIELTPNTRFEIGHVDKEFGAKGFYGPARSREWTRQTLLALKDTFTAGAALSGTTEVYYRFHRDRFLYDRDRPELSDNRHNTQAAGLSITAHREISETTRLSLGASGGGDWIESTALGRHGYGRASVSSELQQGFWGMFVHPGLRADAYGGGFGWSFSPSLAATGRISGRTRWRASAGHAFRVPTFTELYYRDPNHQASSELRPERAWAADGGFDLSGRSPWSASITAFARRDRDLIDWVRTGPDERWQTRNIRRATARGFEFSVRRTWRGTDLLGVEYTYLDLETPGLDLQAKYVSDFARHALVAKASFSGLPGRLSLAKRLEYRRKADGRSAWLLDLRLARRFGRWRGFVDGANLFNCGYQEVKGVEMPGRSFVLGIEVAPG